MLEHVKGWYCVLMPYVMLCQGHAAARPTNAATKHQGHGHTPRHESSSGAGVQQLTGEAQILYRC